jgi:hypothetical protein
LRFLPGACRAGTTHEGVNRHVQPRHSPLIEFLLHLITGAGAQIDAGLGIDGNGH